MRNLFFCLCVLGISVSSAKISAQQSVPYLIPRQIFVGDPATLVVPLSNPAGSNISITSDLPVHETIEFHKITLQQDRLLIDFTAFAPGEFELPIIEIAGYYFPNLYVSVNSIIDRKNMITLSAPASSLTMPGTAIMLYGTMTILIITLLVSIWFVVKGKKLVKIWKEKIKRWRLFANMRQIERRLNRAAVKGADTRIILNKLSDEFRNFLSVLLNSNCRAMTAREIGTLQPQINSIEINFLEKFFSLIDNYRFSGNNAGVNDILALLQDMRSFINLAEKEEKKEAA